MIVTVNYDTALSHVLPNYQDHAPAAFDVDHPLPRHQRVYHLHGFVNDDTNTTLSIVQYVLGKNSVAELLQVASEDNIIFFGCGKTLVDPHFVEAFEVMRARNMQAVNIISDPDAISQLSNRHGTGNMSFIVAPYSQQLDYMARMV